MSANDRYSTVELVQSRLAACLTVVIILSAAIGHPARADDDWEQAIAALTGAHPAEGWEDPVFTLTHAGPATAKKRPPTIASGRTPEPCVVVEKFGGQGTTVRYELRLTAPSEFKGSEGCKIEYEGKVTITAGRKETLTGTLIGLTGWRDLRKGNELGNCEPLASAEVKLVPGRAVSHRLRGGFNIRPGELRANPAGKLTWDRFLLPVGPDVTNGGPDLFSVIAPHLMGKRVGEGYESTEPLLPACTLGAAYLPGKAIVQTVYVGRTKPAEAQVKYDFVDLRSLPGDPRDVPITTLMQLRETRKAVAADGVSRVLLRLRVNQPGVFEFKKLSDGTEPGGPREMGKCPTYKLGKRSYVGFLQGSAPNDFKYSGPLKEKYQNFVESRTIKIQATFRPESEPDKPREYVIPFTIVRPPVVLVHGTYDNPKACWDERPEMGYSMLGRLRTRFAVYTVDYEPRNGSYGGRPSRFETNAWIVWAKENGGIEKALEEFRAPPLSIAVTQADVVGHSMGGVLPRVYASDHFPKMRNGKEHRYRRPENRGAGDVRRLITIGSTHYGSDMPLLFARLNSHKVEGASAFSRLMAFSFYNFADWQTGFKTGAASDQIPGSRALQQVGATPIPAHAIAGISKAENLTEFGGLYLKRGLAIGLLFKQCPDLLLVAFPPERGQSISPDAARLAEFLRVTELREPDDHMTPERVNDMMVLTQLIRAAVFGNQPNDCTVRLESQLGGLSEPYTTVITGVLHGYEPTYQSIQNRVMELLVGGMEPFAPKGFPPAGVLPTNNPPGLIKTAAAGG